MYRITSLQAYFSPPFCEHLFFLWEYTSAFFTLYSRKKPILCNNLPFFTFLSAGTPLFGRVLLRAPLLRHDGGKTHFVQKNTSAERKINNRTLPGNRRLFVREYCSAPLPAVESLQMDDEFRRRDLYRPRSVLSCSAAEHFPDLSQHGADAVRRRTMPKPERYSDRRNKSDEKSAASAATGSAALPGARPRPPESALSSLQEDDDTTVPCCNGAAGPQQNALTRRRIWLS